MLGKFRNRLAVLRAKTACPACKTQFVTDYLAFFKQLVLYCKYNSIQSDILRFITYRDKPNLADLEKCAQCGRKAIYPLLSSVQRDLQTLEVVTMMQDLLQTEYGFVTKPLSELIQMCSEVSVHYYYRETVQKSDVEVYAVDQESDSLRIDLQKELKTTACSNKTLLDMVRGLVEKENKLARYESTIQAFYQRSEQMEHENAEQQSRIAWLEGELEKCKPLYYQANKAIALQERLDKANAVIDQLAQATSSEQRKEAIAEYCKLDPRNLPAASQTFKQSFYYLHGSTLKQKTRTPSPQPRYKVEKVYKALDDTQTRLQEALTAIERERLHTQRLEVELASLKRFRNELPIIKRNMAAQGTRIYQLQQSGKVYANSASDLAREVYYWYEGMQELMMEVCQLHRRLTGRQLPAFTVDLSRYQNIFDEVTLETYPSELLKYLQRLRSYLQTAEFVTEFLPEYADSWDENRRAVCARFNNSTEIYLYWLLQDRRLFEVAEKESHRYTLQWEFGQTSAVRLQIASAVLLLFYGDFFQNEAGAVCFKK